MSEVIDRIEFELGLNDKTGEEFRKKLPKIRNDAKAAGKDVAALVPEAVGKRLTRMNEKTEAARQLLTQFGGAAGGAAGQLVYYGGTLSKVIGGFTKFEWAAIGAGTAIGLLGFAMLKAAREPIEALKKALVEATKETDKATKAANDFVDSHKAYLIIIIPQIVKNLQGF